MIGSSEIVSHKRKEEKVKKWLGSLNNHKRLTVKAQSSRNESKFN